MCPKRGLKFGAKICNIFILKTRYIAFFGGVELFKILLIKNTSITMFKIIGISKLTDSKLENDLSEKICPEKTIEKVIIFKTTLTKYKKPNWFLNFSVLERRKRMTQRNKENVPKKR